MTVITVSCRRSWRIALPVAMIDLVRDGAQTLGNPQPFILGKRRPKRTEAADRALGKQQLNYGVISGRHVTASPAGR